MSIPRPGHSQLVTSTTIRTKITSRLSLLGRLTENVERPIDQDTQPIVNTIALLSFMHA